MNLSRIDVVVDNEFFDIAIDLQPDELTVFTTHC